MRYEVESETPLVLFLGIANRPTIIPAAASSMDAGESLTLDSKDWGYSVTMRRVE